MTTFIPGQLLNPLCDEALIKEPMRVLYQSSQHIWLIPITRRQSSNRSFYVTYRLYPREELEAQCSFPNPMITTVAEGLPDGDRGLKDEELILKYGGTPEMPPPVLVLRRKRWDMIRPLVEDESAELLFDAEVFRDRVQRRARQLGKTRKEQMTKARALEQWLFCYWAGNFNRRAVTPLYGNCGLPGKERKATGPLGRRPGGAQLKDSTTLGFVLTDHDKDVIDYCWRHFYVRHRTMISACRMMWTEFYSTLVQKPDGTSEKKWLPKHQRPSFMQFRTWGEKRNPRAAGWKRHFPQTTLDRIDRALKASANDGVVAVGQRASIDSSPPDLEFVSLLARLKRIGGANRILTVDMKYGYIPGFYYGIDAPSAKTVNLAFLSAMSDKRELLEFLGLEKEIPAEDWIPIMFAAARADNTDLRCEAVHSALGEIGTHCEHTPVARSDMNSMVEAGHHTFHRMVDHNMEGSTYGQRTERGEQSATERARHTIIEGLREFVRALHAYNTMPLNIEPTLEMQRAGVELTRLGLTRWDIERGKVARSLMSMDEARAALLPRCKGTFTKSGVRLLRDDKGPVKRVFLRRLRYFSNDAAIVPRIIEAKLERKKQDPAYFDDVFLYDPNCVKRIWYRDLANGRLIELQLVSEDEDLPYEASLADIFELEDEDALRRPLMEEQRQQIRGKLEEGQERTKQEARSAYQAALDELDKPPSKASLKADKAANREDEAALLRDGAPILSEAFYGMEDEVETVAADATGECPQNTQQTQQAKPVSSPPKRSIFGEVVAHRNREGEANAK